MWGAQRFEVCSAGGRSSVLLNRPLKLSFLVTDIHPPIDSSVLLQFSPFLWRGLGWVPGTHTYSASVLPLSCLPSFMFYFKQKSPDESDICNSEYKMHLVQFLCSGQNTEGKEGCWEGYCYLCASTLVLETAAFFPLSFFF